MVRRRRSASASYVWPTSKDSARIDEEGSSPRETTAIHHLQKVILEVPAFHRPPIETLAELAIDVAPAAPDVAAEPALKRSQVVRKTSSARAPHLPADHVVLGVEAHPPFVPISELAIQFRVARPSAFDDGVGQILCRHDHSP